MLSTHFFHAGTESRREEKNIDNKITSIPDKVVLLAVDATQIHMHSLFM